MAQRKKSTRAQKQEPLAIRLGIAKPASRGKGIRINWDVVYDLWLGWPNTNLSEFARNHGIPYSTISKRPEFAPKDKPRARNSGFRERVHSQLRVANADANDPEALRQIVARMTEAAHAHAAVIRARSVKELSDGTVIANSNLSPTQIRNLSEALKNNAQVMKEILFLAASVPTGEGEDGIKDEPKAVVGKIGAA